MTRDELAALRARVEGLRHEEGCNVPRGLADPDRVPQCNCLRGVLLDLIDGAAS